MKIVQSSCDVELMGYGDNIVFKNKSPECLKLDIWSQLKQLVLFLP